jgi:hypothetical protein
LRKQGDVCAEVGQMPEDAARRAATVAGDVTVHPFRVPRGGGSAHPCLPGDAADVQRQPVAFPVVGFEGPTEGLPGRLGDVHDHVKARAAGYPTEEPPEPPSHRCDDRAQAVKPPSTRSSWPVR